MELETLAKKISGCMLADQPVLLRRLRQIKRRAKDGRPVDRGLAALVEEMEASRQLRVRREAQLPPPDYPPDLPIVMQRDAIRTAIETHQVVIVCGETGSGKTTQLPKICLELGRAVAGMIGHTQPRRIAARSLSARIAEELNTEVGKAVGFKIRFSDHVSRDTYIKVMTDGILLAETQGDPELCAYDTIIIDEAHERSLNIDFILGYLKRLLPVRPDLKVIITSATIDPESFSRHFDNAPIVEVSGRGYPVEVRYRPLRGDSDDEKDRDRGQALLDAVDELSREGPGDILVFLAGERDIREAAELLRKHHPPHTEILPLYGRLSAARQSEVFKPHKGRRIVLATNVAETSLTVPGIRYVVDTGLARVSRYSHRTKVQRLPIEPISQASANQRSGRCGRVAPGICIRLYSEDDYLKRPAFTEPEILRTNLAAVILQMLDLKLGDMERFPFVEPPDTRFIRDGFKLLFEIQAVDEHNRLTGLGRRLAKLPIDVRIGRMILAATERHCLDEVLIIASALSIQDPRERPLEARQAADEKHAAFTDKRSDFIAYLNLWNFYQEQAKHLSQAKLRKLCQEYFLSFVRMREWREVHQQLRGLVQGLDLKAAKRKETAKPNAKQNESEEQVDYKSIHQAILTGLLGNIAFKSEDKEYTGARNLKLFIFPGSGLFKSSPKWIMAAELVETSKRYARTAALIEPEWVEQLSQHLVTRSYSDPYWDDRTGRALVNEQVSLYGLVLVPQRKVDYSPIKPAHARELFIRGGLIGGGMRRDGEARTGDRRIKDGNVRAFLMHNQKLIDEVLALEAKSRRQDILVGEDVLFEFYDAHVPQDINCYAQFEAWYRRAPGDVKRKFFADRDLLMQHGAGDVTAGDFPDSLEVQGMRLPLSYRFEPGHTDDGVTVTVPLAALNQLQPEPFEWLIPGLLAEKVTQLIKTLPKALRRNFVPAPDFARACVQAMQPYTSPLLESLAKQLQRMTGVNVSSDAWQPDTLPPHLRMNFQVARPDGRIIAHGRELRQLQDTIGKTAEASFGGLPTEQYERNDLESWNFGDLPEAVEIEQQGVTLKGYPALARKKDRVDLRLFDTAAKAEAAHREGVLQLFRIKASKSIRYLERNLPDIQTLCLHYMAIGQCQDLKSDLVEAVIATALFDKHTTVRRQADFERESDWAEKQLLTLANRVGGYVGETLQVYHRINKRLKGNISPQWIASLSDVRDQLARLVYPGFVSNTPADRLQHLPRYLKAVEIRLEKLERDPKRDLQLAAEVTPLWEKYKQREEAEADVYPPNLRLRDFRWLLEEFRVSLFAQTLGTTETVSLKRLEKIWKEI
ncbi:MAG TPA: ATP-dependent RNA helicase HrpA [Gammaproteobacteria bacterium]